MGKWYLFWILTVQGYDGKITNLPRMEIPLESKVECIIELEAKKDELELLIGGNIYTTHYFGGQVRLSGHLTGIAVGCDNGN